MIDWMTGKAWDSTVSTQVEKNPALSASAARQNGMLAVINAISGNLDVGPRQVLADIGKGSIDLKMADFDNAFSAAITSKLLYCADGTPFSELDGFHQDLYDSVMKLTPDRLAQLATGLINGDEIAALKDRFAGVQAHLMKLNKAGKVQKR